MRGLAVLVVLAAALVGGVRAQAMDDLALAYLQPSERAVQELQAPAGRAALEALMFRITRDTRAKSIQIAPLDLQRRDNTYNGRALVRINHNSWLPVAFTVVLDSENRALRTAYTFRV